jgi:hypothetical protein
MGNVTYKLMSKILAKKIQEESAKILEKYKQIGLTLDPKQKDYGTEVLKLVDKSMKEIREYIDHLCLVEYKEVFEKIKEEERNEMPTLPK